MRNLVAVFVLLLGGVGWGCGGGPDASPDAPDAPPPQLVFQTLVVSAQTIPQNNAQAREIGLDLGNGGFDGTDNQLGQVLGALTGQGALDPQTTETTAIDRGTLITLIRFGIEIRPGSTAEDLNRCQTTLALCTTDEDCGAGKCNFSETPCDEDSDCTMNFGDSCAFPVPCIQRSAFETFVGTNPTPPACDSANDTVCRHHLDGSASFEVDPLAAQNTPLTGDVIGREKVTTPISGGNARLQLLTTMGTDTVIALDLVAVRITAVLNGAVTGGVLAGGVLQTDLDTKILPAWQQYFMSSVARDCSTTQPPDCGCAGGSQGQAVIGLFDSAPQDCTITVSEIRNNSFLPNLFTPDLTVDGQPALSIGLGFEAVSGSFTAP